MRNIVNTSQECVNSFEALTIEVAKLNSSNHQFQEAIGLAGMSGYRWEVKVRVAGSFQACCLREGSGSRKTVSQSRNLLVNSNGRK